ncbi:MAG: hypothetical protein ABIJ56_19535, partial [Pseudomonadota bacterium]
VRDYLKFTKRGYARTTHLASIDVRNGRISREEGIGMALETGAGAASNRTPVAGPSLQVAELGLKTLNNRYKENRK